MSAPGCAIAWWGHACVAIDLDGVRLVTDPVLTRRAVHLTRRMPSPRADASGVACDAVLISHLHMDHLHLRSLRRLQAGRVVGPTGLAAVLSARRWAPVDEVSPGDRLDIGGVMVEAVRADHGGRRHPFARDAPALGYVLRGSRTLYFAGDTGVFPDIADAVPDSLDVAVLPIWGWGPRLGRGHLDPLGAAKLLAALRPEVAVPVHWGTYAPAWVSRRRPPAFLTRPVVEFAEHAARLAPDVRVAALRPDGPELTIGRSR